ncbi:hypothetical protein [Anaeromyxobacter sp. K]|uniref:hypothetical protein n=1 Tax=Anaeromyxobacter sp. (strain K) TaxID=447217 RepID=UPI000674D699|nr:hypothetical protein [Anaeromyxobacter sp. K]
MGRQFAQNLTVSDVSLDEQRVPVEGRDEVLVAKAQQEVVVQGRGVWQLERGEVLVDPLLQFGEQRLVLGFAVERTVEGLEVVGDVLHPVVSEQRLQPERRDEVRHQRRLHASLVAVRKRREACTCAEEHDVGPPDTNPLPLVLDRDDRHLVLPFIA